MKKRILSLCLICLFSVLCLVGCGGGELSVYPVLSTQTAKAGDSVTVSVYIDDCKRLCATDLYLSYDPAFVTLDTCKENDVEDLYAVLGAKTDEVGNPYLAYSCYALETVNLDKTLLFTATFTVNEQAAAGDSYFGIAVDYFNRGDDAKGTTFTNIESEVIEGGVHLSVTAQ